MPLKIFVLTTGNPERVERISNQLKDHEFEFIKSTPTPEQFIDINLEKKHNILMTKNERNTVWTHYRAWEQCVKLNEPILIIEDGADINNLLWEHLNELEQDVLKLGVLSLENGEHIHYNKKNSKVKVNGNEYICIFKGLFLTRGYIVTPKVAYDFMQSNQKFFNHVDAFINECWIHGNKVYKTNKDYVTRAKIPSVIGVRGLENSEIKFSLKDKISTIFSRKKRSFKKILYRYLFKN